MAGVACLTEVAMRGGWEVTELRGSFLGELRGGDDLGPGGVLACRAVGLRSLARGRGAVCGAVLGSPAATSRRQSRGSIPERWLSTWTAAEARGVCTRCAGRRRGGRPATLTAARGLAARLQRHGTVGMWSPSTPTWREVGRAIQEAELVLDVLRRSDVPIDEDIGTGTYRLLFRVLASHPEEVRSFYDDTVAPLVAYDGQTRRISWGRCRRTWSATAT